MKPIIQKNNFTGGMTLNEKLVAKNQFHIGYGLDFTSRSGYLTNRPGFTRLTLSGSADVGLVFQGITYTTEDGNIYLGADNATLYLGSFGSIASTHASAQTGAIRGLIEYKGFMYYPQNTTIGRSDLAGSPTYTDDWKTGLTNVDFHPMKVSADNKLYIGDDRYVASWDDTTYTAQALDIQDDWEIQCLSDFGVNYLAIGANNKLTTSSQSQGCKVVLWSRANSTVWDDEIDIPEKTIYAMIDKGGYLWVFAGSNTLSVYAIPIGSRSATKVFTFENDDPQNYEIKTYPNAVGYKDGRIYFAISCDTSASSNTIPGVYSISLEPTNLKLNLELNPVVTYGYSGQVNIKSLEIIGYSGQVSKGTLYVSTDNGATENIIRENLLSGDTLYINNAGYETEWFEAPAGKKIYIQGFGIDMLPRTSNTSVMVSYKIDGDTSFTDIKASAYQTTDGIGFFKKLSREGYRIKLKLTLTGSTNRPYVSNLYVRGQIQDDPRTDY